MISQQRKHWSVHISTQENENGLKFIGLKSSTFKKKKKKSKIPKTNDYEIYIYIYIRAKRSSILKNIDLIFRIWFVIQICFHRI